MNILIDLDLLFLERLHWSELLVELTGEFLWTYLFIGIFINTELLRVNLWSEFEVFKTVLSAKKEPDFVSSSVKIIFTEK